MVGVFEAGNLFVVRFDAIGSLANANLICNALAEQDHPGVHEDSLYQLHIRLGHLSYVAFELVGKPESGIRLTDHQKSQCVVCAEGKQNSQQPIKS